MAWKENIPFNSSGVEVKNGQSCNSVPPYVRMEDTKIHLL